MGSKKKEVHLDCPEEIESFLINIFNLKVVARRTVGRCDKISFTIHSNEGNHSIPHVHASCQGYEISIAIKTAEVLCGNLPPKQTRKAVKWVEDNKERLLHEWTDFVFSASCVTYSSDLANK